MRVSPAVLTAAVTQASLRSVLHKLLAAGPAFNVTALLAAAQQTNQGTALLHRLLSSNNHIPHVFESLFSLLNQNVFLAVFARGNASLGFCVVFCTDGLNIKTSWYRVTACVCIIMSICFFCF